MDTGDKAFRTCGAWCYRHPSEVIRTGENVARLDPDARIILE